MARGTFRTSWTSLSEDQHVALQGRRDSDQQRLWICTFHPAYGYEDFVEGLKARPAPGGLEWLVVEARQHVGVFPLGPLQIRIRPKLPAGATWAAVTYALGLDGVLRHPPVALALSGSFADLLGQVLVAEADRLWRRGILQGYEERSEWRSALRGRPDLAVLARSGPLTRAALPCRHHVFTADIPDNRVVLGGLALAAPVRRPAAAGGAAPQPPAVGDGVQCGPGPPRAAG